MATRPLWCWWTGRCSTACLPRPVPESANSARKLKGIAKDLADWLYYNSRLTIQVHPELEVFQEPGERERSFKVRLRQAAREHRDAEVDALAEKYATPHLEKTSIGY
jgi:hypothetical protein